MSGPTRDGPRIASIGLVEIVYAAHTDSAVFMLDANGVCRWAVANPGHTQALPERIVGSQYVATLDLQAPGGLVDLPRVGCPMLFVATDEAGRIRLVRTPPVLRFEERTASAVSDDERTPARPSSVPPPPSTGPLSLPLPLVRPPQPSGLNFHRTPLPPPPPKPASRPPLPPHPMRPPTPTAMSISGVRPAPISVPTRLRNPSLKRLARGK